jgi:magnesium transporter
MAPLKGHHSSPNARWLIHSAGLRVKLKPSSVITIAIALEYKRQVTPRAPMNFAVFRSAGALPNPEFENARHWLDNPENFVLLYLDNPDKSDLKALQTCFGLHDLAIEDASSAHQRPKLEEYGDTLFIALHTGLLRDGEVQYGELHIFVSNRFMVMIQHKSEVDYSVVNERCLANPDFMKYGAGFVLYTVLDYLVDELMLIGLHLQVRLERLESMIFENRFESSEIQNIYAIKRRVARLHNMSAPVGDICQELSRLHPGLVSQDLTPYYRDVQDHVQRTNRHAFMLRDALSDALQVNLSLITIRQNEVVKRLAGWGAILTLPTIIFTMYGTNFKYMPLYEWDLGYPVVLALTGLACRELYKKLKHSGWL